MPSQYDIIVIILFLHKHSQFTTICNKKEPSIIIDGSLIFFVHFRNLLMTQMLLHHQITFAGVMSCQI